MPTYAHKHSLLFLPNQSTKVNIYYMAANTITIVHVSFKTHKYTHPRTQTHAHAHARIFEAENIAKKSMFSIDCVCAYIYTTISIWPKFCWPITFSLFLMPALKLWFLFSSRWSSSSPFSSFLHLLFSWLISSYKRNLRCLKAFGCYLVCMCAALCLPGHNNNITMLAQTHTTPHHLKTEIFFWWFCRFAITQTNKKERKNCWHLWGFISNTFYHWMEFHNVIYTLFTLHWIWSNLYISTAVSD